MFVEKLESQLKRKNFTSKWLYTLNNLTVFLLSQQFTVTKIFYVNFGILFDLTLIRSSLWNLEYLSIQLNQS